MGFYRLKQKVIDLSCHGNSRGRVERLTAGLIVREHLHANAGRVHCGNPRRAKIKQLGDDVETEQLFAIVAPMRARGRAALFSRQNEVLLKRNYFHVRLSCSNLGAHRGGLCPSFETRSSSAPQDEAHTCPSC